MPTNFVRNWASSQWKFFLWQTRRLVMITCGTSSLLVAWGLYRRQWMKSSTTKPALDGHNDHHRQNFQTQTVVRALKKYRSRDCNVVRLCAKLEPKVLTPDYKSWRVETCQELWELRGSDHCELAEFYAKLYSNERCTGDENEFRGKDCPNSLDGRRRLTDRVFENWFLPRPNSTGKSALRSFHN